MNESMRIITLWQPWATLIALGLKQYETRSWTTSYRGKLAIHAAKRPVKKDELASIAYNSIGHLTYEALADIEYPLGAILAIVELKNCWRMIDHIDNLQAVPSSVIIDTNTVLEKAVGDWQHGRYAWRLEDIQPLLHPVPFKGGQGLRKLDDAAVLSAIASQLASQEAA